MSKELNMLEIPNIFEKGDEPSIATLSQKFNIAAERFNEYPPIPMFRTANAEKRAIRRDERPDSYILLVDHETAAEINEKLNGNTMTWSNSRLGPT